MQGSSYKGLSPGVLQINLKYRYLLALALGGIGSCINYYYPLEVFFGLDLLFGNVFAYIALILCGLWPGLLAGIIAKLVTLLTWQHGYGVLLTFLEFAWLGLLPLILPRLKGRFFIVEMDVLFWLGPGLVVHLLGYGWLLGLEWGTALLVYLNATAVSLVSLQLAAAVAWLILGYLGRQSAQVLDKMVLFTVFFIVLPVTFSSLWVLHREDQYFQEYTGTVALFKAKTVAQEMAKDNDHVFAHLDHLLELGEISEGHIPNVHNLQGIYLCTFDGSLRGAYINDRDWPLVQQGLQKILFTQDEEVLEEPPILDKKVIFSLHGPSGPQIALAIIEPDDGIVIAVYEPNWAKDIAAKTLAAGNLVLRTGSQGPTYTIGNMPPVQMPSQGEMQSYPVGNTPINEQIAGGVLATVAVPDTPWSISVFHPYRNHWVKIFSFLMLVFLCLLGRSSTWWGQDFGCTYCKGSSGHLQVGTKHRHRNSGLD